jgi:hypothetical protein
MLFLLIAGFFTVAMVLLVYGTIARNRRGINFSVVSCPRCKTPLRQTRVPKSSHQAIWGGYTCAACRVEVDKWGRQILAPETQ